MTVSEGQQAFFMGELTAYRKRLGLSKAALAEILGVSLNTLYRWESHAMLAKLNDRNAEMVAQFCRTAEETLQFYPDFAERYVTLARRAQYLGVTQEFLFREYRDGVVKAEEFGMLGIFCAVPRL